MAMRIIDDCLSNRYTPFNLHIKNFMYLRVLLEFADMKLKQVHGASPLIHPHMTRTQ